MQRAESGLRVYLYNKLQVHHRGLIAFGGLALLCLPGLVELGNSEGVKLGLQHYNHWCSTRFYAALALLGLPYYMYAFIWHYPVQWNLYFKGRGVEALSVLCFPVSKVLQAVVLLWWMIFEARVWPKDLVPEMQRMSIARMVLCASLSLAGQTLNAGVYRAIGHDGVYYGCKLGRKVPWTTAFPYNLGISHPQYVGAVLTIWGLAAAICDNLALAESGLIYMIAIWTGMYVVVAFMEEGYLQIFGGRHAHVD